MYDSDSYWGTDLSSPWDSLMPRVTAQCVFETSSWIFNSALNLNPSHTELLCSTELPQSRVVWSPWRTPPRTPFDSTQRFGEILYDMRRFYFSPLILTRCLFCPYTGPLVSLVLHQNYMQTLKKWISLLKPEDTDQTALLSRRSSVRSTIHHVTGHLLRLFSVLKAYTFITIHIQVGILVYMWAKFSLFP